MAKVINHFIPKPPNLGTTTLTENGTYTASNDGLDGYSQVAVNVQGGGGECEYGYKRVSGVPDGAELLANAVEIEVGGVTYMPIYILINYANTLSDTYTKTGTGVASGADAYLFSDAPTTLEVGTSVTHTWDLDKDIATVEGWKCRWVMAYAVKAVYTSTTVGVHLYSNSFEFIGGVNLILNSGFIWYGSNSYSNYFFKYINLGISTAYNNRVNQSYTGYACYADEVVMPNTLTTISGHNFLAGSKCFKVVLNGVTTITNYSALHDTSIVKIELPELTTLGSSANNLCSNSNIVSAYVPKLSSVLGNTPFSNCRKMQYVEFPALTEWKASVSMPQYCTYIKLPNDFNISAVSFTFSVPTIQWFYDLAGWLFDRSATTAGTIILGADNLAILNSLYLEDGTTPLTSVFDAKNWTRS